MDGYKSDEVKQLERLLVSTDGIQFVLEEVRDVSLAGARKSLVEIVRHGFEVRWMMIAQTLLLALILWRVW